MSVLLIALVLLVLTALAVGAALVGLLLARRG